MFLLHIHVFISCIFYSVCAIFLNEEHFCKCPHFSVIISSLLWVRCLQCHQVCVQCLMGNVVLMKLYCSAGRKNNVTQCVQGGVSVCSVVFGGLMVETWWGVSGVFKGSRGSLQDHWGDCPLVSELLNRFMEGLKLELAKVLKTLQRTVERVQWRF